MPTSIDIAGQRFSNLIAVESVRNEGKRMISFPIDEIVHVGMLKSLPSKFAVRIGVEVKLFDTREEAQAALNAESAQ